ncbi:hypothetical protein V8B55DRAFT_1506074 [Mucor lusitanicus]|uniref:Uncharacterized protein n=2 Tax=Mucor circinelloides f. lusitanicus TaxID=29924 RepID=A0A168Q3X9_MUCCL|nr:hypothetical protein FB192DRAFT_1079564 [Mucor lusitanicus]OAD08655.1 hypothetical protein MUCCIDRAFT_105622 [Mucor lusitanicus CBS 277.49]
MVDNKQRNTTLKKLARWTPSSSPSPSNRASVIPPLSNDAPFVNIHHDKLQQGALYIIKIKQVSLAMFEGWNDDMCCFSILRSEVEPLRWSEARQLPGDFDIYNAFDECGNPPIHLWSRYLRTSVPSNWFSMFEEAKRKQRNWAMHQEHLHRQSLIQQKQEQEQDYYYQQPEEMHDNASMPAYSNTDVSSMHLNGNTITSPSIVASTNVVDPSMMHEELDSNTSSTATAAATAIAAGGLHHQPSATSVVTTATANSDMSHSIRRPIMSPTPSLQPSERSNSIMDREQIRRHLAPGQATVSNRQIESPQLVHHRSKEYITQNEPTPLAALSDDKMESNISTAEVDFPHDSDRFSIHSESITTTTPTSPQPPAQQRSLSSKTNHSKNRSSMKKMIFG